jgi:hypothetical protein
MSKKNRDKIRIKEEGNDGDKKSNRKGEKAIKH